MTRDPGAPSGRAPAIVVVALEGKEFSSVPASHVLDAVR
jgi:hypothetical protein